MLGVEFGPGEERGVNFGRGCARLRAGDFSSVLAQTEVCSQVILALSWIGVLRSVA
jgi:hypothetical protein